MSQCTIKLLIKVLSIPSKVVEKIHLFCSQLVYPLSILHGTYLYSDLKNVVMDLCTFHAKNELNIVRSIISTLSHAVCSNHTFSITIPRLVDRFIK